MLWRPSVPTPKPIGKRATDCVPSKEKHQYAHSEVNNGLIIQEDPIIYNTKEVVVLRFRTLTETHQTLSLMQRNTTLHQIMSHTEKYHSTRTKNNYSFYFILFK